VNPAAPTEQSRGPAALRVADPDRAADVSDAGVLIPHIAAAATLGTTQAVIAYLPFLGRVRFSATDWQTTVLTAAVPVMQLFSIFWNQRYARWRTPRYLIALGLLHVLPIGLVGLAPNIWVVMACFVVAAFGNAGMSPLNADLLRTCYPHRVRGRVFGYILTAQMGAAMLTGFAVGRWSDRHHDAFRAFLPAIAAVQTVGLLLLAHIARRPIFVGRTRPERPGRSWLAPLREMRAVLRADRDFAAYEIAFMSYGIGWMVCTALIPVLATDKLHLNYGQYTLATIVLFQLVVILLFAPAGHLVDRVGPMRLAAVSFLWLTLYPVGLLLVKGFAGLAVFSAIYAVGMVGVNLTWTLGPVALASDPSRASHYLAIHTTMVGIRGIVAQGLGMALYVWTGSFAVPLLLAAAGFLWAAIRMNALARSRRTAPAGLGELPPDAGAA
jgi:MFS family permease